MKALRGKLAVLVVDDDDALRDVMMLLFSAKGISAAAAADGVEAFRIVVEREPEVLITDLHMPRMSGMKLVRSILERLGSESPVVVAVSADYTLLTTLQDDSAYFALLKKPISPSLLVSTVREALESHRSSGS